MAELYRHDITLFKNYSGSDTRRVPAGSVTVDVYREGAEVSGPVSIANGAGGTVQVYDPGAIVSGDTVQKNTDSSVTRTVSSITGTTVVLSTGSGALSLSQYDRLVPTNNRPKTWLVDQATSGNPSTSVASQATTDATSGTATFYTGEPVVDLITTDGSTLTLIRDQTGVGGRSTFTPQIYGAKADGTADDQGAFEDLFEYLKQNTSGVAEIPAGNYILASGLTLTSFSGMKIRGAGIGKTFIVGSGSGVLFDLVGCGDVEISGMTIYKTSGTAAIIRTDANCYRTILKDMILGMSSTGIGILDRGVDTRIADINAVNGPWNRVIHLYTAIRPFVTRVKALWTGTLTGAALDIDSDVVSARISDCDLRPATVGTDKGIALRIASLSAGSANPLDIQVTSSRFSGGTGAGGLEACVIAGCDGGEFTSCSMVESLVGYSVTSCSGLNIVGGRTYLIRNDGIDINGGTGISITGHQSSNVNVGAGTANHVDIAAGVDDVSIIGLRVGRFIGGTGTATASYGVKIATGASDRIQVMGLCGVRTDLTSGWISNGSTSTDVDLSHNLESGTSSVSYQHIGLYGQFPMYVSISGTTATASVKNASHVYCAHGSATAITNFTDANDGQVITVVAANGNTSFADAGNFALSGAYTLTANDTLTLVYNGTLAVWVEVGRSVN